MLGFSLKFLGCLIKKKLGFSVKKNPKPKIFVGGSVKVGNFSKEKSWIVSFKRLGFSIRKTLRGLLKLGFS